MCVCIYAYPYICICILHASKVTNLFYFSSIYIHASKVSNLHASIVNLYLFCLIECVCVCVCVYTYWHPCRHRFDAQKRKIDMYRIDMYVCVCLEFYISKLQCWLPHQNCTGYYSICTYNTRGCTFIYPVYVNAACVHFFFQE